MFKITEAEIANLALALFNLKAMTVESQIHLDTYEQLAANYLLIFNKLKADLLKSDE